MLINYKTSVINLDKVSEFVKQAQKTIKFFFDSYDHETNETTCSFFEFDSEEERDSAFEGIINYYAEQARVIYLD